MNKPKIRFKGFEGEWKEMQFEVAFEYQRNNNLSRAELSDEGIVANIHYGDVLIKYGECLDVSKDVLTYVKDKKISMALYKKGALRNGDVIFADAAEDNTVGKCTEVICEENVCIVSGLHTIACRPQVEIVERYLGYSLNSPSFHNQLLPHIQGTKISSISKNALSSTSISLPSLHEQRALASYFTSLDAQIAASTSRLSSLKQIKAASLLNMFPQKGETVPRVRFKGFQGEWKERKLGEVFSERVENNINGQLLSVTLNKGIIRASENGKLDNSNSDKSKYKVVNINDIAYNSMRMWQGASGCSKYEGIVSPAYTVITPKEDIDSSFFSYLFKTEIAINKFRLHSQGLTSDNWNLKYPAFSKIDVYCPLGISEQQAIASYFTALDAQITLHRERLEKLKQIKAACLEKMFA